MSNDSTLQCKQCGLLFTRKENLQIHNRIHTEKKTFVCTEENCEKSFISNDHLKRHIRNAHGLKTFECENCKKTYKSLTALRKHERTHNEKKRFICTECNAGFDISEQYKIHVRQHKQILPYQCRNCGKKFASRSVCRRHKQNIHYNNSSIEEDGDNFEQE